MSEKDEKRKTLLKDIEGKPIVFDLAYDPYVGTAEEVRGLARARGDLMYENPKAAIREQGTRGFNEPEEDWKETMAENRKAYEKKYKEKISKYPGNVIFGAKAPALQSPSLPESVAYLDGTMPRKVAKPTIEQAQTQTPAVKEETPVSVAQATATEAVSQKEEMPAAQSRYDKAIAYINEASKSPSWRERRDIRKMEKAAKKEGLIEAGKKRKETEPIAWETDLEEVEIIGDKKPTPEKTAPKKEAPVAQTPAPAVKTAVEDGGKKTILWPERPEMEKGDYVADSERRIAQAQRYAEQQERKAKRDRDMAIISDIANLVTKGAAMHGGAWKIDKEEARSAVANEKLRALRESNSKLLAEYARQRMEAADADRKERNAAAKARYDAEVARAKWEADENYRNARLNEEESYHNAQLGIQGAREERLKNQGGGKSTTGRSGSGGSKKENYTVDGNKYETLQDAYVALPDGAKVKGKPLYVRDRRGQIKPWLDDNGNQVYGEPTAEQKKQAISNYNARTKPSANKGKTAGFSSGKTAGFK